MPRKLFEPSTAGPATRRRWPRLGWRALVGVVAALVVAVAVLLVLGALGGGDEEERVAVDARGGAEVSFAKPEGWSEVSEAERGELPGRPLAVLRRDEGDGLVILNAQSGRTGDLDVLSRGLDRQLRRAVPDFRKVSSRPVRVKAGQALLYSYVRKRRGTAHTLLVVPAGERSYTLNAAVPAGAEESARDAGKILFSFER